MTKKAIPITHDLLKTILDCMSNGCSEIETAAALGISKGTFLNLRHRYDDPMYDDLMETIELGRTKYEAWFESVGKDLMTGKIVGKDSVWKAFGQNKFKWSDKTEVTENTKRWDSTSEAELTELLKKANLKKSND